MPFRKIKNGFTGLLDLLESAFRRYLRDGLITRANAIAYAAILGLIPLLAVLVKFASIDRASLQIQLARLLAAYGITESGRLLVMLDEILARANAIAGVGTLFVLYSANNLIRHMEDAFNHVFRAPARPYLFRFAIYIASFVILPVLLFTVGGLYRKSVANLSPPAYVDLAFKEGSLYLLESTGRLEERSLESISQRNVMESLNLNAPFRDRIYEPGAGRIVNRISADSSLTPMDSPSLSDVQEFRKLGVDGAFLVMASESGLLVFSDDGGTTWDYRRYLAKTEAALRPAFIEDLILLPDRIVVLTGDGLQSTVLVLSRPNLAIIDVNPMESAYRSLSRLPDGIYVGGSGRFRISRDQGFSWSGVINASFGNRNELIQSIHRNANGDLVYLGGSGNVWLDTADGQRLYPAIAEKPMLGHGGLMLSPDGPGFFYGADGQVRVSTDGGRTWIPSDLELEDVDILSHASSEDYLFLGGTNHFIGQFRLEGIETLYNESGAPVGQRALFERGPQSRYSPALASLLLLFFYLQIFGIVWLVLALLFRALPNRDVSWKSATVGSLFSALCIVGFFFIFRVIVSRSTTTAALYGVYVAIPLGMVVLLSTVQIILFGLEISFLMQHPERIRAAYYLRNPMRLLKLLS